MPLTAQQHYEIRGQAFSIGREILAKLVVFFGHAVWFVYKFLADSVKMVLGK